MANEQPKKGPKDEWADGGTQPGDGDIIEESDGTRWLMKDGQWVKWRRLHPVPPREEMH